MRLYIPLIWPHFIALKSEAKLSEAATFILPHWCGFILFWLNLRLTIQCCLHDFASFHCVYSEDKLSSAATVILSQWSYWDYKWGYNYEDTPWTLPHWCKRPNSSCYFAPKKDRSSRAILRNQSESEIVPEEPTGTILMSGLLRH